MTEIRSFIQYKDRTWWEYGGLLISVSINQVPAGETYSASICVASYFKEENGYRVGICGPIQCEPVVNEIIYQQVFGSIDKQGKYLFDLDKWISNPNLYNYPRLTLYETIQYMAKLSPNDLTTFFNTVGHNHMYTFFTSLSLSGQELVIKKLT